jgi:hypothetical protein
MSEKELHDLLLAEKPEGAHHNEDKCPICLVREASQEENVAEITQEQHQALLDAAVEKAKDEATAVSDAEILSLGEQLAAAKEESESQNVKVTELEALIAERDESDRLDVLADERAELVRAADINFSDEQIEDRKLSWAKKDEEEFNALVEDYKAVATAKSDDGKGKETPPPSDFDGTRETAGDETTPNTLKEFFGSSLTAADSAL